ncbi:MAG: hypothetical protein ACLTYN_13685 [Dysosmobacter welbionis]
MFQLGFMRRFDPPMLRPSAVDAGEIGKVVLVRSCTRIPAAPLNPH